MKFKYVIFDFDGTLADTEKMNFSIFQQLSQKYNFKEIAIEELNQLKKMSAKEVIQHLDIKKRKIPFALKKGKKIQKSEIHTVALCKENIKSILEKLEQNGIKLGIITSNSHKNVKAFLEANDINVFDFIISSSLFGKEIKLRKTLKKLKLKNDEVLYIGDEIRDIIAAHLVKINIASVSWGYNTVESLLKHNPDYIINDPEEILSLCLS